MDYLYAVLLGVTAGVALNNILILSNISSISASYQTTSAGLYASPVIIEVIGLGVIVPVLEECLYRGVIFRRIRDMVDARKAILFSALIFAVVHWKYCTVSVCVCISDCFCHMPMRLTKVSKHRFCCTVQQSWLSASDGNECVRMDIPDTAEDGNYYLLSVHLRRLYSLYRFEIWRTQKKAGMASHRFQACELDVFH